MKKLPIILIILGVLVMLSPLAGKLYMEWQDNRLLEEWYNSEDASEAEYAATTEADPEEALNDLQQAFSPDSGEDGSTTATSAGVQTTGTTTAAVKAAAAKEQNVLGVIKIDKIKIKYPVVEGVKASNLRRAIGHVPGTAQLGQPGNCALAGHRNYTFGRYFNRLDEVQTGDIISVSTKKAEYKYKVFEKIVVKPTDVSVLKGSKDDTVLSLITCTPIYIASHRLIVKARLEQTILLEP